MAANRFLRSLEDFRKGIHGIIRVAGVDGYPEMTAEGLAAQPDMDVSKETWLDRFEPTPIDWVAGLLTRFCLGYYDLTAREFLELAEEHGIEIEQGTESDDPDVEELPIPTNTTCPCGESLPENPPEIVAKWNKGVESTAVCFNCFGEIKNRIRV